MLGARVGFEVADGLYVGGGAQAYLLYDNFGAIGYGNVTFGEEDRNLSLAIGKGFGDFVESAPLPIVLSGIYRIKNGFAWLTENWFLSMDDEFALFQGIGGRIIRPNLTVDIVLVNTFIDEDYLPLPWVDFAWYFDSK